MKIQLLEPEIKLALEIYIKSRIKFDEDSHLEMEFTAGRNPASVSVDIDIVENNEKKDTFADTVNELAGIDDNKPFSDSQNNLPFTTDPEENQSFLQED